MIENNSVTLAYEGRDGVVRTTRLSFDPAPYSLAPTSAAQRVSLEPGQSTTKFVTIACGEDDGSTLPTAFTPCLRRARRDCRDKRANAATIYTSNELFNEWMNRSLADLYSLVTKTDHGPYPFAGIPWFSTVFGRDGIITALQFLWMDPSLARGVLAYLAATQATVFFDHVEATTARRLQTGKDAVREERRRYWALGDVCLHCSSFNATKFPITRTSISVPMKQR